MARDFRHGPAQRRSYQRQSQQQQPEETESLLVQAPVWLWALLLTAMLVGGFIVIKHFAKNGLKSTSQSASEIYQPQVTESPSSASKDMSELVDGHNPNLAVKRQKIELDNVEVEVSETNETDAPRYTFYSDLPETEVVVNVEPLPITLTEPMWIQAGSFRELTQAQQEKQRLESAGRKVDIAPVDTAKGTYYRILSGPYNDRLVMNQERNHLRRMGADTRVVKLQTALR